MLSEMMFKVSDENVAEKAKRRDHSAKPIDLPEWFDVKWPHHLIRIILTESEPTKIDVTAPKRALSSRCWDGRKNRKR